MKLFAKERNRRLANAILLVLFGILMSVFSAFAAELFAYTVGTIFIIIGIFYLTCFFLGFSFFNPFILLQGLLNLLVGSIAISSPDTFNSWVFYLVAFFIIYQGILEVSYSFDLKIFKVKNWWLDLLYGIVMIALSITLIVLEVINVIQPSILMIFGGACMIVSGGFELILILALHRTFRRRFEKDDNDHDDKVVSEQ